MNAVATTAKAPKVTDRSREERRLGWMLSAPAVIAMLLVTAYPICYAIGLSLQNLDLRFPDDTSWAGLTNYKSGVPRLSQLRNRPIDQGRFARAFATFERNKFAASRHFRWNRRG